MSFKSIAHAMAGLVFVCASLSAMADGNSSPELEYNRLSRPSDTVAAFGSNLFGDSVDPYNGQASFDVTDISIPGNGKLPVALGRHLDVAEADESGGLPSFANWEVDVPYLTAYYSDAGWAATTASYAATNQRCSVANAIAARAPNIIKPFGKGTYEFYGTQYWSGITLRVPGAGSQELLVNNGSSPHPSAGGPAYWVTKSLWTVRCEASLSGDTTGQGGEGFVATAPDGTSYYFDVMTSLPAPPSYVGYSTCISGVSCNPSIPFGRAKYFLLASRVTDRFGNWVKYNYSGNRLTSIVASDGREIDVSWGADGNIQRAVAIDPSNAQDTSHTWNYSYTPIANRDYNDNPNLEALTGVALPDGSAWGYRYAGNLVLHMDPPEPNPTEKDPGMHPECTKVDPTPPELAAGAGFYTLTATSPSGEQGVFQFQPLIRGLSNAVQCTGVPMYPWTRKQFAMVSKTLTDPTQQGSPSFTWAYTYSPPNQSFAGATCNGGPCPTSVWTDVQAPDGTHTRSTFGNQYQLTEGQLQEVQTYTVNASGQQTVLDDATTSYVGVPTGAAQPYPQFIGTAPQPRANVFLTEELHPQLTHAQVRDGVTFQSTVHSFDTLARPLSATASSTQGYSRTDVAAYADNTALWVLGQPASLTNTDTGVQVYSKTYDPATALPTSVTSYGALDASYTFNADGSLHTVADGNGHVTTLGSYYRGVPQSLQYADGTTRTATVDDFGHITAITDPIGTSPSDTTTTTTTFGYDVMGRLNQIVQPAGDSVAWLPTTVTFAPVNAAEYGLQAGHWKQVECTGANACASSGAVKVTYFDGQWQPVLTRTFDAANPTGTQRFATQAFDFAGRPTFASSAVASLSAYNATLAGVHTAYDGLGRPITATQDSELGPLTTRYAYLPGFITQVTNPRGYVTGTAYQVFDAPDTRHPTAIVSPEGVTTTIARDVFGK
ncbi:MAG: hypothetical protein JSR26_00110, partial [Proteobacteria bacterium]|nr:hypothetical protein [Pseudomonadota bacterium]